MANDGMTLVKQECANLVANVCIGMTTKNTLFREVGACYLAEGETCDYYDIAVVPLILKMKVRKKRWAK